MLMGDLMKRSCVVLSDFVIALLFSTTVFAAGVERNLENISFSDASSKISLPTAATGTL